MKHANIDTSRCILSPLYADRIKRMHDEKIRCNVEKLKTTGGAVHIRGIEGEVI